MSKLLLFCVFSILSFQLVAAEVKRIALITPRREHDAFWGPFSHFASLAANHFNMLLKTYYANEDHITMTSLVEQAMKSGYDAVILSNFKMQGKHALALSQKYKIPLIFVTGGFDKSENMSEPRMKYPWWIGQLLPDDQQAGEELLEVLYQQYRVQWPKKIPNFFGIEGNIVDSGSYERKRGAEQAIRKYSFDYTQFIAANWSRQLARDQFISFKKRRYPQIDLIWCASDLMAIGVVDAAKHLGLRSGVDFITGGVDWSPEGLEAVASGDIYTTIGGHLFQGGWAVILLYDYFNGFDFATERTTFRTEMKAITKSNINYYKEKLSPASWSKINFSQFSKARNAKLKNYDFSLSHLFSL